MVCDVILLLGFDLLVNEQVISWHSGSVRTSVGPAILNDELQLRISCEKMHSCVYVITHDDSRG